MYTKEDVTRLIADLGAVKSEKRQDPKSSDAPDRYIGNRDHDPVLHPTHVHNVDLTGLEIGAPYRFGLSLEIFDPESGAVITACRPHRLENGESEIFLTPTQIAVAVLNARSLRTHNERAGLIPPRSSQQSAGEPEKRDQRRERITA